MPYLKSSHVTGLSPKRIDTTGFTQSASEHLEGTYSRHEVLLADAFTVTDNVTISDNLILAKLSDDGNAITVTGNASTTRTISGSGSLEGSTFAQTPNASLTGMTGTVGSAVTLGSGVTFPVGTAMNGPAFSAYKTVDQTIANNTLTKVLFETEDFDTNNNFASSRFTPTVAGYYVLSAMVILGAGSFSRLHLHIYKNGATHRRMINQEATSAILDDWSGHGSLLVYANGSGDYFEVWMDQRANSTTGNLGANSGSMRSWVTGYMVRTG